MQRPQRPSGFTLVELMVTIAVAAVIMTIAVPSFTHLRVSGALTTQANSLTAGINLARSEAIRRNASVHFCRTATDSSSDCANAVGDWNHWAVVASGDILRRGTLDTLGNRITITSDLNQDRLRIGPDGMARSGSSLLTDGYIQVKADGGTKEKVRCVRLGPGSRLSVERSEEDCS
ncbi:GspH/FimT family pseudopilin [Ectothiorhodospira variabilis]|uniref:GspH/FimT family pseudopilin n=1 Tax=Ectothiorhodospira variabilis TaxID=505694 RepID=UPI001EFB6A19|nr:GspH/FimT family pseudopilin [Ectothiorhodospira variabilis]MCG5493539.1 GspH/FimT family pseudopilin [Ectothiorhodospira variabilis]MCG5502868.1 GspH/FimT family pseudopilin [Ectothiorhodospira variabilis]MCG5506344.1 GspH/FimT family pseudopilin [Ectothiorhodospira variabilis]